MLNRLGKIKKVSFGACGYQEAMLGLRITLGGEGWGVDNDICGGWDISRSPHAKWTEDDRIKAHGEMCIKVSKLLKDAKVDNVASLQDKPVKCFFEGNLLKSFEILTEVL